MTKKLIVATTGLAIIALSVSAALASGMFVATAQNFRGALYQGYGPTPGHACENAVIKCTQDSFIPPSCRVIAVRMDCPPPACFAPPPLPPMRKPIHKSHASRSYPAAGPWGSPMP